MNWSDIHFLRPEYFLGFAPLLIGVVLVARQQLARHSWQQSVDPELLPFLLEGRSGSKRWWTPLWLALLGSFLILAMTGPSIHKVKIPVIKQQHAAVIVIDLSISMYAQDLKPSRLKQTHFFVADLLKARKEGQTGLIAFTADAFVVAPLTDDTNTLLNLLPTLEPTTMPMGGSNPLAGIRAAEALMSNAKAGVGHIILISDGIVESQLNNLISAIKQSPHKITVLGVGTDEGAPIPAVQGGFYKEENGSMIVASLGEALLKKLCRESGCRYQPLRAGGDVKSLAKTEVMASDEESASIQREFDAWQDGGAWLVLCALPFCLVAFRRGWLITLPLLLVMQPEPAMAADWQSQWHNLWQTQNQQAAEKLETAPAEAAAQFEDPRWRAAAQYRADDFEAAAESWSAFDDADAHYNRGNALAKSGALEDAITAYDRALTLQPDMEDALRNKAIVEALLKQQEQQEQEQDQNQDQQDQNQEQQDGEQQQGDGGEQSQQDQEKQNSDQENQSDKDSQQQQSGDKSDDKSGNQQQGDEEQSENQQQSSPGDEQREQQEAEAKAEQEQAAREAEEKAAEQQAAQQGELRESDEKPEDAEQVAVAADKAMDSEEQQELKQWLRKIPDDPSGLLRRKFESQSAERRARKQLPELENVAPY